MRPAPTRGFLHDPRHGQWAVLALLVLAGVLGAALVHYDWQRVADDAFIAFRYARNLQAGLGLVWNAGERVEGFSSPLWLGLLILGRLSGVPLPAWAGGLGVLFLALSLLLVWRVAARLSGAGLPAAAACAVAAALYPLQHWAASGLETTLFAALVTAAVWGLVAGQPLAGAGEAGMRPGRASLPYWWYLVAAALGLARPEGPVLAGLLVVLGGLAHGRAAWAWQRVAVAGAPVLAWLLFRRFYYGDWLPNPYYAKATGELVPRMVRGLLYAFWGITAWLAAVLATRLAGPFDRRVVAALGFLAAPLAMVIGAGGDWMWHGRLLAPVLPGLAAIAVAAVARARAQQRAAALLACGLAFLPFAPSPSVLGAALGGRRIAAGSFQEGTLAQASLAAAGFVREHYPPDALVAVNHAGALPYQLPNPVIDMTGLCDWHIAHERQGGLHQKFDPVYVLARRPDLVVLNSKVRPGSEGIWYHKGYWQGETALVDEPGWQAYRPVEVYWPWRWGDRGEQRFIVLYQRVAR